MTKYFIDSEFIDDGRTIDLISIGIVSDDGREYYAQSVEFDPAKASGWVKEHVLAHLNLCEVGITIDIRSPYINHLNYHRDGQCKIPQLRCPWRTRKQIAQELAAFLDAGEVRPEFVGWCSAYDYVALCQIFGTMLDTPAGWPHYIRDIQPLLDDLAISDDQLPAQEGNAHNALDDARHIQRLWRFIQQKTRQREALAEITRLGEEMGYD